MWPFNKKKIEKIIVKPLPCLCGNEDLIYRVYDSDGLIEIVCTKCDLYNQICAKSKAISCEDAIQSWNRNIQYLIKETEKKQFKRKQYERNKHLDFQKVTPIEIFGEKIILGKIKQEYEGR